MVNNKHTEVGFDNYHQPGCMLGMFHILGYRNWLNNVKKMLPHKSHGGRTHTPGDYDLLWHSEDDDDDDREAQRQVAADSCDLAERTTMRPASASKKSTRARIKALMGFSTRPSLQKTYSIHHVEPALDDYRYLDQMNTDWQSPIIVLEADNSASKLQGLPSPKSPGNLVFWNSKGQLQGITDVSGTLLEDERPEKKAKPFSLSSDTVDGDEQDREFSNPLLKESIDVLEVYKINKDLFMKSNRKTKVNNLDRLHSLQTTIRRAKLTKSGSFPMTDQSDRKNLVPIKLEDKQKEAWSVPKGDYFKGGNRTLLASRSLKDLSIDIMSSVVANTADSTEEKGLNDPDSVTSFSSDSKQRRKDMARAKEKGSKDSRVMDEIDEFLFDMNKHSFYSLRRASSLNESRNRNAQLSESSSRRKMNRFKSLSLADEFEIISGWVDAKHFRRLSSLHDASTYLPQLNEGLDEYDNSGTAPELACITSESCDHDQLDERIPKDSESDASNAEDTDASTNLIERCGDSPTLDGVPGSTVGMNDRGDTTSLEIGDAAEFQETQLTGLECEGAPNSVLETYLEDDINCTVGLKISEGKEMDGRNIHSEEQKSASSIPEESNKELLSGSIVNKDVGTLDESLKAYNDYILPADNLERDNDATFIYVRNILERLGVTGNQNLKQVQPVDVSFFNDIETLFPDGNCDDQLWFDTIYESLLDIYERSYTYWPKALSSNCHIRTMASGNHILEEVWSGISKKLNTNSGPDCTLDQIVALDFRKDDGWMNCQADSECVALDLEDIIFDEILDQILFA